MSVPFCVSVLYVPVVGACHQHIPAVKTQSLFVPSHGTLFLVHAVLVIFSMNKTFSYKSRLLMPVWSFYICELHLVYAVLHL